MHKITFNNSIILIYITLIIFNNHIILIHITQIIFNNDIILNNKSTNYT